jgi:hypothetical protein
MDSMQALDELFRMDESTLRESLRNELEAWRIEYQEFYKWIAQEAAPSSRSEQERLRDAAAEYELPAAKTFIEWKGRRVTDDQLLDALKRCMDHYGGRKGV